MTTPIYHLTTRAEADAAARSGEYFPTAFAHDHFTHCSHPHQVARVANHLFHGRRDLVLLEIARARLTARVIDENLESGTELFPHVYGAIPWSAVTAVLPFTPTDSGTFRFPG
jgi:uncharacterized protein (DUF952 family)